MPLSKTLITDNLEEAKKLIAEIEAEKPKGIAIRRLFDNSVIFQSTKQTMKDAVIEALKNGANYKTQSFTAVAAHLHLRRRRYRHSLPRWDSLSEINLNQ